MSLKNGFLKIKGGIIRHLAGANGGTPFGVSFTFSAPKAPPYGGGYEFPYLNKVMKTDLEESAFN